MALYGFTNQDISTLIPVARFWNQPPALEVLSGALDARYDKAQKAYVMDATGSEVSLALEASDDSPLKNPCFVIGNWEKGDIHLSLNGKELAAGDKFRYGIVPAADGYTLVAWIQTELREAATVLISK
jgi:hypothetical protein